LNSEKDSNMKVAFLILAHDRPFQLQRLVGILRKMGTCFIHIDADATIEPFLYAVPASDCVFYAKQRYSIRWAGFGMIDSTLTLIHAALAHGEYDYFIHLSGLDYPIKSNHAILKLLAEGGQYLDSTEMPHPGHSLDRLHYFFIAAKNRRSLFFRLLNKATHFLPRRNWRKGALKGMTPSSGSQWWGLSRACILYIEEFVSSHPEYSRFLRHSKYPDEMFFQTIVRSSPFASQVKWQTCFADWSRDKPPYPAILDSSDLELLRGQKMMFARKFQMEKDSGVFDLIDAELRADKG
jgi:hypothetical protein